MSLTRPTISIVLAALLLPHQAEASEPDSLIAEAIQLAKQVDLTSRPDFPFALFRVLLIDGDEERLFCAGGEVDGFSALETESATECGVQIRAAVFNPEFLATFPLQDGVPTVVVGTPASTGRAPDDWVAVLVHEHFHQRQQSWSEYFAATLALDLHDGDQTGMWMLDYAFDYDNAEVAARFARLAHAAATALESRSTDEFEVARDDWTEARRVFIEGLTDSDRRYFEFQLWQEGVARYVELEAAIAWREHPATAESVEAALAEELRNTVLSRDRRVAFYPLGAVESYLLTHMHPDWAADYFDGRLALGPRITSSAD